jgi:hypothetical protein
LSKSDPRPRRERIQSSTFVEAAVELGYEGQDAQGVWRRAVQVQRGARFTPGAALAEYLTKGQLADIVRQGRQAFRNLPRTRWQLLVDTTQELVDEDLSDVPV